MTSDPTELCVLHWNIHSWTDASGAGNVDRVADLIARVGADVVSLVEVNEPLTGPAPLETLIAKTGFHSVLAPAFEYGPDRRRGQFGNAILSRVPILDVRHHQLLWPPRIYDGTEPSEPRSVILCRIHAAAGPMWIGSTHLPSADAVARNDALRRLLTMVTELVEPWLLLGDFNTDPSTWHPAQPALRVHPQEPAPTYPTDTPAECIDYCIAPRNQQVHAEVMATDGADHLPILVRFRMSGAREGA